MAYIGSSRYLGDQKTIEAALLSLAGFIAPFLVHQQVFLGILVNALLIRAAFSLPGRKALPVLMAPSIGSLMNGLLFGPFTIFLAYLMPVIWLGNGVLVHMYKRFGESSYPATVLTAAGCKTLVLFTGAYLLHSASMVPAVYLTAMGLTQLFTAVLGGIAYRISTASPV